MSNAMHNAQKFNQSYLALEKMSTKRCISYKTAAQTSIHKGNPPYLHILFTYNLFAHVNLQDSSIHVSSPMFNLNQPPPDQVSLPEQLLGFQSDQKSRTMRLSCYFTFGLGE
jgi:hypothetical protein